MRPHFALRPIDIVAAAAEHTLSVISTPERRHQLAPSHQGSVYNGVDMFFLGRHKFNDRDYRQ